MSVCLNNQQPHVTRYVKGLIYPSAHSLSLYLSLSLFSLLLLTSQGIRFMSCALLSLLLLLARPCHVAAAVQSGSRQSCYPICSGCTTFSPLFFLSSLRKKKKEDSCTWSWSEKSGPVGRDDSARFWPVLGRSKLLAPFRLLPFISLSSSSSSTLALPSSPSSDGQVPLRSPSLVRWWPCL